MKARFFILTVAAIMLFCLRPRAQAQEPSYQDRSLSEWIEQTKDRDPALRERAAAAIGEMGPKAKAAVPALTKLLYDTGETRNAAARALGAIGPEAKSAVPTLIKAMPNSRFNTRDAIADALGNICVDRSDAFFAAPALAKLLENEYVTNRWTAAKALGKMGNEAKIAVPQLAEVAVDSYDDELRETAVSTLVGLGPYAEPAAKLLVRHLRSSESDYVKCYALYALSRLGPCAKNAVPDVAKLLRNRACHKEAFTALTNMGAVANEVLPQLTMYARDGWDWQSQQGKDNLPSRPECVNLIVVWSRDPSPIKRAYAERLWNVLGPDDKRSILPTAQWTSQPDRETAINKLSELGQEAVPALIDSLKDRDPQIRRTAVRTLEHLGSEAKVAVPVLVKSLHDKDWQVRAAAAIALGHVGADAVPAVTALGESLSDMDGDVRVCAIEALGRIGPPATPAVRGLIARLSDKSPAVRSAAARALGQIGPAAKPALPMLEKLRDDPQDYVRTAAEEALKSIATTH